MAVAVRLCSFVIAGCRASRESSCIKLRRDALRTRVVQAIRIIDMASSRNNPSSIRYEPEEKCPPTVAIVSGLQGILLVLTPTVLTVAVAVNAAGQDDSYLIWATFATLIIVAGMMVLQASRFGRIGGGHLIITGITPNYIAISVLALAQGGPSLLASLIVVSAFFYVLVGSSLPLLRRIITPAVAGTVLMLVAAMVLPIAFDQIGQVPSGISPSLGIIAAAVTAVVSVLLMLKAPSNLRPWSILIGVLIGFVTATALGFREFERVTSAPWFGIPDVVMPGIDFTPDSGFWVLLPMFLIVTLVQVNKSISDGMVVQQASRRLPRATDFRLIQGSINANGAGILVSGIAGTPPTSTYSAMTISFINLTGVTARSVSYAMAGILVVFALFPKFSGVMLSIPAPVMGGFYIVIIGLIFVEGIITLIRSGIDHQKTIIVGLAFAAGLGMEFQNLFEGVVVEPWDDLLGNGITIGTLTVIGLTAFMNLTGPRAKRIEIPLDIDQFPTIDKFLQTTATTSGWHEDSARRLRAANEEALTILTESYSVQEGTDRQSPRLRVSARQDEMDIELEYVTTIEDRNIEDTLAYLGDEPEITDPSDISYRLLRHYASSVKHQKYHGLDILTVVVSQSD